MFAVVVCPRCRRSRIFQEGKSSTSCGSCGKDLALREMQIHAPGATLVEAQAAAGQLNARLAGREAEFATAFLPTRPPSAPKHDDAWAAAGAATRKASSAADRADAAARSLTEALGAFGDEDLARAFRCAGIPAGSVGAHLARMLATAIVHEPRPGRYRAL